MPKNKLIFNEEQVLIKLYVIVIITVIRFNNGLVLMKLVATVIFIVISINVSYAYSPKIIAHRGGKINFPENTIYAFESAINAGSDGFEVDVQLSRDGVVVLYHPNDLSLLTDGKGLVSSLNYKDLAALDAAYNFDPQANRTFPTRNKGYNIPTLSEVIEKFPNLEIIIDLKSLPAKPLIDAVVKLVDEKQAWNRLIFYSTNDDHLEYLKQKKPEAKLFESRNKTRQRLLTIRNEGVCCCKLDPNPYIGFEMDREMVVEESFTLGNGSNKIHFRLWDNKVVECIQEAKGNSSKIFIFGVNNKKDYEEAKKLGAYAVFSDSPIELIQQLKHLTSN